MFLRKRIFEFGNGKVFDDVSEQRFSKFMILCGRQNFMMFFDLMIFIIRLYYMLELILKNRDYLGGFNLII